MTRRDYILLARPIRETLDEIEKDTPEYYTLAITAGRIARELKLDNPRFDRERFMTACGF